MDTCLLLNMKEVESKALNFFSRFHTQPLVYRWRHRREKPPQNTQKQIHLRGCHTNLHRAENTSLNITVYRKTTHR